MNRTSLFKYIFITVTILLGVIYAAPNLFGEDPALQVSSSHNKPIDAALEKRIEQVLAKNGIKPKSAELSPNSILVRFDDTDTQLKARDLVSIALGEDYSVALNLAPATPKWLVALGAKPMYLGLDLRGGVHFLLSVDTAAATKQAEERFVSDLRTNLREKRIRYHSISRSQNGGLTIEFLNLENRKKGEAVIAKEYQDLQVAPNQDSNSPNLNLIVKAAYLRDQKKFAIQQNLTTLRNRVNELGVAEPVIQQQGEDHIVVELPGVQDTARAKDILGATATLEFHMVDTTHDLRAAVDGKVPPGSKLYKDRKGEPVLLKKEIILTGDSIIDAASGFDQQSGTPNVSIRLDGKGGARFSRATRDNVGKPLAVVFIENKTKTIKEDGKTKQIPVHSEQVINVATIREELGRSFQITGLDSTTEARNLALLLRAGALAAPIQIIEERTVGPSLGQDNIRKGMISVTIAMGLVLLLMASYYRVFGLTADFALLLNLVFIVAIMSLMQATLTLPGIAGIVLTLGVAVDANVLINERVIEELRNGNTPQASINAGYERAWATILDSNITTLIAGVLLFGVGSGPIKGFAITLCIGIVTSMFTAVTVTRVLINTIYGSRRVTQLSI